MPDFFKVEMREEFVFCITLNRWVFYFFYPTPFSSVQQIYLNLFLKGKCIPYFWAVQAVNIQLLSTRWSVPASVRELCGASPSPSPPGCWGSSRPFGGAAQSDGKGGGPALWAGVREVRWGCCSVASVTALICTWGFPWFSGFICYRS